MGKAYSEDERQKIKIALMESALDLFHENGTKSLSIRELTNRVGISQGGFYTFWPDKDALVLDVIKYRAKQKLDIIVPRFTDSLADPRTFLADLIYSWITDMKSKIRTNALYSNSVMLLRRKSPEDADRIAAVYSDFLENLSDYWIKHQVVKSVDITGLISLIAATGILLTEQIQIEDSYVDELLKIMIDGAVNKYISI